MAVFGWRGALWDVTAAETGNHSANGQEECGMSRPAEAQVDLSRRFKEQRTGLYSRGWQGQGRSPAQTRQAGRGGGEKRNEQNKMERWEGRRSGGRRRGRREGGGDCFLYTPRDFSV